MSTNPQRGLPLRAAGLYVFAATIGCSAGLLGYGFQRAIAAVQWLFFESGWFSPAQDSPIPGELADCSIIDLARSTPPLWRVALPALGGLCAALALLVLRNRRGPFGITDIMEIAVLRRGTIRARDSVLHILASLFSIGSGASLGKEAANSQLGATIAAKLGDWFSTTSRERSVLLGCGIAAGMAFSYNAPIAGALFVMEVVLGNFAMDVFAPIVVASVSCTLVRDAFVKSEGLYQFEGDLTRPDLVIFALILGGICGVGGIGLRATLQAGATAFRKLRLPLLLSLPIGGALVGLIGLGYPETWGNGYHVVRNTLTNPEQLGNLSIGAILLVMVMKAVATSIATGSGALGGVFTPTLLVGAALGAVFSGLVGDVTGTTDSNINAGFALVGMAGLVAATTHAPITAILLVFEFTRDYDLILPVMLCSIMASVVARLIDRESIYSARLKAKGHDLGHGLEELTMQTNYVRDMMRTEVSSVTDIAPFEEVMDTFASTRRNAIHVVDPDGNLLGLVHLHDVKNFINDPSLSTVVIAGDLMQPTHPVTPDQTLASVLPAFDDPDLEELPVVVDSETPRLIGRLTRRDVIALLNEEVLGQRRLRAKLKASGDSEATYVELPANAEIARVTVPDELANRAIDTGDLLDDFGIVVLVVIEIDDGGRELRKLPVPGLVLPGNGALIVLRDRRAD